MEILKTTGMIAGIGGISLGALLIIFREIIRKNLFANLTKSQSSLLLYLITVLTWSVAVLGIICWTYVTVVTHEPATGPDDVNAPRQSDDQTTETTDTGSGTSSDAATDHDTDDGSPELWETCGDPTIDHVIDERNKLVQQGTLTEAQAVDLLRQLFDRPAFIYLAREQNWEYGLFAVCKTRLLLQAFKPVFKANKGISDDIGKAIVLLVALEGDIATLYGPAFTSTQHIDMYIDDKDLFLKNMPAKTVEPDSDYDAAREKTVKEILRTLSASGITNDPG